MAEDSIKDYVMMVKLLKFEADQETTTADNIDQKLSNISGSNETNETDDLLLVQRSNTGDLYTADQTNMNMTESKLHSMLISEKDASSSENGTNISILKSVLTTNINLGINITNEIDTENNGILPVLLNSNEKELTIPAIDEIRGINENVPQIQNSMNKETPIANKTPFMCPQTKKLSLILSNSVGDSTVNFTSKDDDDILYTGNIDNTQLVQQNENSPIKKINNFGFTKAKSSEITYYCLIDGCTFSNEYTQNLRKHFNRKHFSASWNGYCYTCLSYTLSGKSFSFVNELKHMIDHITNLDGSKADLINQEDDIIEYGHDNDKKSSMASNGNENVVPFLKFQSIEQSVSPFVNATGSTNLENTVTSVAPIAIKEEIPLEITVSNMPTNQMQIADKSETSAKINSTENSVIVLAKQPQTQLEPGEDIASLLEISNIKLSSKSQETDTVKNHCNIADQPKPSEDFSFGRILKKGNINRLSKSEEADSAKNFRNVANQLKPWTRTASIKNQNVIKQLLRDVCLFSLYKCMGNDCAFTTNSKEKMLEHIQYHEISPGHIFEKLPLFECSYCHANTGESNALTYHIETEHIRDIYQCPYCFYRSCSEQNVLTHLSVYHWHENRLIFVCIRGPKHLESTTTNIMAALKINIRTMHCSSCKKSFIIIKNYIQHMLHEHPDADNWITCGMCCRLKFSCEKLMIDHLIYMHNTGYAECVYCSFATNFLEHMPLHLADFHSTQLPYICVRNPRYENHPANEQETVRNSTTLTYIIEPVHTNMYHLCPYTEEQLNFMSPSLANVDGYFPHPIEVQWTNNLLNTEQRVQKSLERQIGQLMAAPTNQKTIIPIPSKSDQTSFKCTQSLPAIPIAAASTIASFGLTIQQNVSIFTQPTIPMLTTQRTMPTLTKMHEVNTVGNIVAFPGSQLTINNKSNLQLPLNTILSVPEIQNVPYVLDNSQIESIDKLLKQMVAGTGFPDEKLYHCGIADCSASLPNVSAFYLHMNEHSKNQSSYKCYHCKAELRTIVYLRRHLKVHASHRYFCYFCEVTASSQKMIRYHCICIHQIQNLITKPIIPNRRSRDKDFFILNYCDMNYTLQEIEQMWFRKMSKTNRIFSLNDIAEISNDITHVYEIYCSICRYGTKSQNALLYHILNHNTDTDIGALFIQNEKRGFDPSVRLVSELNIPIFVPKLQRFVCGIPKCDYKTINASTLKYHTEMHKFQKLYKCPHCDQVICQNHVDSNVIIEHLKFHSANLWQCSECSYYFYFKDRISSHIPMAHPYTLVSLISYVRTDEKTIKINQNTCNDGRTLIKIKPVLSKLDEFIYNLCASKNNNATNTNQNFQVYHKSTQDNQYAQTKDIVTYTEQNVEHPQTSSIKNKVNILSPNHIINGQLNKENFQNPLINEIQQINMKNAPNEKDPTNVKDSNNRDSLEQSTFILDDDDENCSSDSGLSVPDKVVNNSEGEGDEKYTEDSILCHKCYYLARNKGELISHLSQAHKYDDHSIHDGKVQQQLSFSATYEYVCSICTSKFCTVQEMINHVRLKHNAPMALKHIVPFGNLQFECVYCSIRNTKISLLYQHWLQYHKNERHKLFLKSDNRFLYKIYKQYMCALCDAIGTYSMLLKHYKDLHKGKSFALRNPANKSECGRCNFPYSNSDGLLYHFMLEHTQPEFDDICDPYLCLNDQNLKYIAEMQTDSKVGACKICSSVFVTLDDYNKHHIANHIHKNHDMQLNLNLLYRCHICKANFSGNESEIVSHFCNSHRLHECRHCGMVTEIYAKLYSHSLAMHPNLTVSVDILNIEKLMCEYLKIEIIFSNGLILRKGDLLKTHMGSLKGLNASDIEYKIKQNSQNCDSTISTDIDLSKINVTIIRNSDIVTISHEEFIKIYNKEPRLILKKIEVDEYMKSETS